MMTRRKVCHDIESSIWISRYTSNSLNFEKLSSLNPISTCVIFSLAFAGEDIMWLVMGMTSYVIAEIYKSAKRERPRPREWSTTLFGSFGFVPSSANAAILIFTQNWGTNWNFLTFKWALNLNYKIWRVSELAFTWHVWQKSRKIAEGMKCIYFGQNVDILFVMITLKKLIKFSTSICYRTKKKLEQ